PEELDRIAETAALDDVEGLALLEHRRGPFPDIARELARAERAHVLRVRAHGIRSARLRVATPARDPVPRLVVPPRVEATVGPPSGLLPLLLRGKVLRDPAAVLLGVGGAHADDRLVGT